MDIVGIHHVIVIATAVVAVVALCSRVQKQGHCIPYWIQIVIESRPYYNNTHCIKTLFSIFVSFVGIIFFFATLACVCSVCMLRQWKLFSEAS